MRRKAYNHDTIAAAREVLRKARWREDQILDVLPDTPPRVIPHNLDAEASLLGGIFLRNKILDQLDTLEVEDFYSPKHQSVFGAIRNLEATSIPIDPITVEAELDRQGKLESVGGLAFLGQLALNVPSVDNVLHYAAIVKGLRTQVRLIEAASEILDDSFRIDADEFIGAAGVQRAITRLMSIPTKSRHAGSTVRDLMIAELKAIEADLQAYDKSDADQTTANLLGCVPTGISGIDLRTGGFPIGIVSSILGGSGHGKSVLIGTSVDAVVEQGDIAIVYSIEDPKKYWAQRALARATGIATEKITRRRFDSHDEIRRLFAEGYAASARRNEVVIAASGWSIEDIVYDARALRHRIQAEMGGRKRKCAVYIDYWQVVRLDWRSGQEKKTEALGRVMSRAQWLAHGCGSEDEADMFAVIGTSQVKSIVAEEKRAPERDDASDSAEVGRVSKYMLGLHRPAEYDTDADPMLGLINCLKWSQGDSKIAVQVTLDLATHSIRDCRDAVYTEPAKGRTTKRWQGPPAASAGHRYTAGPERFDDAPPPEDQ